MLILPRFVWCHIIWYILENVPGILEKNVYYAAVGLNVLYTSRSFGPKNCSIPMFSCWFYVWKTYSLLPRKYWNLLLLLYRPFRSVQFSSVHSLSHLQLFVTPRIAARQASLSITNSRSLLKLMSIESVMPSSHLILCHPLVLLPPIPPSIRVFSNESTLCMRWPKYWSFSFSISPSKEHPGLISFRMSICLKIVCALMLGEYILMVIISSWCNNPSIIM